MCTKNIANCEPCFHLNDTTQRPSAEEFYTYLPWFLNMTSPTANCLLYGSIYSSDIIFSSNETYGNTSSKTISSSRFLLHHTVLKTQAELIDAVKTSYDLTDNSKISSFPYSPLYIYFEPYLVLEAVTVMIVLVTLAAVFITTVVFLSNPWTSVLVIFTICMIIVDLMGAMRLWNVSLNAVSLVNLVMAIGISAQYCVHIAFAFLQAEHGSTTQRAIVALTDMGTPVICGVSMTKVVAVVAFAFTQSEMFHIYYFIMYLALIILGMAHGVVFLPVLLSIFGTEYGKWMPFTYKKKEFRY
jgi:Niemann-Pick C1 protein